MRALLIAFVVVGVVGCHTRNPLTISISCRAILSLDVGASHDDVEGAIGRPPGGKGAVTAFRPAGSDEKWLYNFIDAGDDTSEWDALSAYFSAGHLVHIESGRRTTGRGFQLAYRLSTDPDGRMQREYGPAFEKVFACEPGYTRPAD